MNILILGDGLEERSWARWLSGQTEHVVVAAFPGFPEIFPDLAIPKDFEAALAVSGVELMILGGAIQERDESLRRAAGAGLAVICMHPPGTNADGYYQVALSREETGALVVPDMPGRLHPGIIALRDALSSDAFGAFRNLRIEAPSDEHPPSANLANFAFPRWVDVARVFLGEVKTVNAIGDPPGIEPTRSLTVQLQSANERLAEMRLFPHEPAAKSRITLTCERATLTLELASDWSGPSRLQHSDGTTQEFVAWDAHAAIFDVLQRAKRGEIERPNLLDGTRAMELASAVVRGLKRGRAVDLNYEEVSETNNFKTIMTSVGCMILLSILFVLPLAMAGPSLGIPQTIYIAYAIPPILLFFFLIQSLKLAIKPEQRSQKSE